jgi:hypothetical protein
MRARSLPLAGEENEFDRVTPANLPGDSVRISGMRPRDGEGAAAPDEESRVLRSGVFAELKALCRKDLMGLFSRASNVPGAGD